MFNINKADTYFVTRAKATMDYSVVDQNYNIDESTGLKSDGPIIVKGCKSEQRHPETLRLIESHDDEKDLLLVFLSNKFEASSLEIAYLYKNRSQREIFQVDKAEPNNQKIVKKFRKCSQNPYLGGNLHLSDCCLFKTLTEK